MKRYTVPLITALLVSVTILSIIPPMINFAQTSSRDSSGTEIPAPTGKTPEEIAKIGDSLTNRVLIKVDSNIKDSAAKVELKRRVVVSKTVEKKLRKLGRTFAKLVPDPEDRLTIQAEAVELGKKNIPLPEVQPLPADTTPSKKSFWHKLIPFLR